MLGLRTRGSRHMQPSSARSKLCTSWFGFIGLVWLAASVALSAQPRVTLEQAGSRTPPDWTPTYETQNVLVTGQVSLRPIWVSDSYYVAIQDDAGYGLLLQGNITQFQAL